MSSFRTRFLVLRRPTGAVVYVNPDMIQTIEKGSGANAAFTAIQLMAPSTILYVKEAIDAIEEEVVF